MGFGPTELIVILVIVVLLFGAKKLPELSGAIGKSLKEFRKAADEPEVEEDSRTGTSDEREA